MSTIRTETVANLDGTSPVDLSGQQAAKVYWDWFQSTLEIRAQFGVSSFTDTAAGQYRISYTPTFTSIPPMAQSIAGSGVNKTNYSGNTTTQVDITTTNNVDALTDLFSGATMFGDLV